jgi:phenylpropionate dioxygenase-like ring-hydroxylating dioxygenase large terminal subunit
VPPSLTFTPHAAWHAQEASQEQPGFDFAKHWYPLQAVENLDPKVPHPVELLGKRLVLWRDGAGEWRCFEDKCPHRLAPLSGARHLSLLTKM